MVLTFKELTDFGIPNNTIKHGVMRYRKGLSSNWKNLKDKKDSRKVLILIDSIPPLTREKYNIPTSAEYKAQQDEAQRLEDERVQLQYEAEKKAYEKESAKQKAQFKKDELLKKNTERKSLLKEYNSKWHTHYYVYKNYYASNPRCEELATQSAKDHAFWLKMLKITGTQFNAYKGKVKVGFDHYQDIKERVKLTTNTSNIIHFRALLKELREAHTWNETAFINKIAVKNTIIESHRTKTDEFHKGLALSILSHEKIYPYRVVADLMNHHCIQQDRPTITESWVKGLMFKDKEFKALVNQYRYGEKYFEDWLLPYALRDRPTYPGNVWMIDGTPIQFYCYNETRTKLIRLYLFAIIDVCTRKIVGYDVGFSEDRFTIMEALKLAVKSEGHLPAEIVSDNFSANKSEEILEMQKAMEKMEVYWRHSKVGNAKDKSYIERYFGVFQTVECALYDDYIGEGIKSKRLNARPSAEYLQQIAKKKNTPTVKEMTERIAVMISTYNQRVNTEQNAPNEAYKNLPKPNIKEMDLVKTSLMFWNKTTHTIKRGMVKIKVKKTEYAFEIYEHSLKAKLQETKVAVRYDPNDLETVMLFDLKHDRPICECKRAISIHMGIADRTEQDELNTAIIEAKKKSYKKYLKDQYDNIIDAGLKSIGKDTLDIIHPLNLDKNTINAEEDVLYRNFMKAKGIDIGQQEKREYKPIKTMTRKHINPDAHESLLQKKVPCVKGTLKVVGKSNRNLQI